MEELIKEFASILNEEENLLNTLNDRQVFLRAAVTDKNWMNLLDIISEINTISDSFQKCDVKRDSIQENLKSEQLKPFMDQIGRIRSKLLKCKVQNQALSEYVVLTRQFIQRVVEEALPQTRNKNYTRYGMVKQPEPSSVLVDVRG